MTKHCEKVLFCLAATLLVACAKAALDDIPKDPFATEVSYPSGPVSAKYAGEAWNAAGGEARIVEGMDEGTKLLEITLWPDARPTCAPVKPPVTGKEVHLLVAPQPGQTRVVGINPDGAMVTFQYASGSTAGSEFATESYVLIESMDNGQVKGKVVGNLDASYSLGGEYTVPLCP